MSANMRRVRAMSGSDTLFYDEGTDEWMYRCDICLLMKGEHVGYGYATAQAAASAYVEHVAAEHDETPVADAISHRYPPAEPPRDPDDPLHDVWVGVFRAIGASPFGLGREDIARRVWGVVEPLLRREGVSAGPVADRAEEDLA